MVVRISVCRIKSMRNDTGSTQHRAGTWEGPINGSQGSYLKLGKRGAGEASEEAVVVEGQRGCEQRLQTGSWGALLL